MAWGYMRAQDGGAGAKEMLCGNYYWPDSGNAITCMLFYLTKDGGYADPNIDNTVSGEYLEISAIREGVSWSKGINVTAKKPFSGVLYTSPNNGIYQNSQDVTYNTGDTIIGLNSTIGRFILEIT